MSRINITDEEERPGQFALWHANCQRSIGGRAGQKSLRELRDALLALPTKRLIAHELDNGTDCCAVGALVRQKGIVVEDWEAEDEMEEVGVACGMPRLVAWKVVELNDELLDYHFKERRAYTPEERYEAVMRWIEKNLVAAESPDRTPDTSKEESR